MIRIAFDVDDSGLREAFLRDTLAQALEQLTEEARPRWGSMTAQQVVEHLIWSFELSTGAAQVACDLPPDRTEKMKRFLHNNKPMMREFMNPVLVQGLPALRFARLAEAKAVLVRSAAFFRERSLREPASLHTHPVFGPLSVEEWDRSHFKHVSHHLAQFELIEVVA